MAVFVTFFSYFLISILILLYGKFLYSKRNLYKCAQNIPGLPNSLPIIGDLLYLIGDLWKISEETRSFVKEDGILKMWFGSKLFIGLSNPEYISAIINTHMDKGDIAYNYLEPILGKGLLTSTAQIWKQHRKIMSPIFSQKKLNEFVDVFVEESEILAEKLSGKIGKEEFDVMHYSIKSAMDMVCRTMIGVNPMSQDNEKSSFYTAIVKLQEIAVKRCRYFWLQPQFLFNLTKYSKITKDYCNLTDAMFEDQMSKKHENKKNENEYNENEKKKDLLDRLIEGQIESKLTMQDMKDECYTTIIAGYETSGTTESILLTILGFLPHIQEKVMDELSEIYGGSMRPVSAEDLPNMKYLERALLETLRLFPVAPIIGRKITQDVDIGKYTIPADCTCIFDIYKLHRREEVWGKNVLEFDPDRFLPENSKDRHILSFFAFSGGVRNCIGKKYAIMSMKVFFATILRQYKIFSSVDYRSAELFFTILISLKNGAMISIERRENF